MIDNKMIFSPPKEWFKGKRPNPEILLKSQESILGQYLKTREKIDNNISEIRFNISLLKREIN